VLRAPWCGLTLEDLHALASDDGRTPILSRMLDAECLGRLSADGRQRLDRVRAVLLASRDDHGRQSLGSWVRACWLALQAPATLEDPVDLDNVESCFVALDRLAAEVGPMPSGSEVEAAVDGLMASPTGSADARVQLMTIHKAKGLEFDTVILPGLEKTVASHSRQLLYWATVAVEGAPRGIVLASRGEPGDERQPDRLEAWMRGLEVKRAELELGRLAYVAATRARRRLHLAGAVRTDLHKEGHTVLKPPRKGSMLRLLWKVLEGDFEDALGSRGEAEGPDTSSGRPRRSAPPLTRLPLEFEAPSRPASVAVTGPQRRRAADGPIRPQFEWAGAEAIAVGTVLHAELERLGRERQPVRSLVARPDDWANGLQRLGLPQDRLPGAVARIGAAVTRLVRSETAARLLDPDADQAASELGLTAWLDGEFATVKIDRTFVDAEGVRWIVDWKTGSHEGADVEQFLAQEVGRYGAQLERYARVMALHDPRPQCVGLYFPLLDRWKAWSP